MRHSLQVTDGRIYAPHYKPLAVAAASLQVTEDRTGVTTNLN